MLKPPCPLDPDYAITVLPYPTPDIPEAPDTSLPWGGRRLHLGEPIPPAPDVLPVQDIPDHGALTRALPTRKAA
jgi:hypothetical protein